MCFSPSCHSGPEGIALLPLPHCGAERTAPPQDHFHSPSIRLQQHIKGHCCHRRVHTMESDAVADLLSIPAQTTCSLLPEEAALLQNSSEWQPLRLLLAAGLYPPQTFCTEICTHAQFPLPSLTFVNKTALCSAPYLDLPSLCPVSDPDPSH